jgi:hypothetical protein
MLSVIGERNVELAAGLITGFTPAGFTKGPNSQDALCPATGFAKSAVARNKAANRLISDTGIRHASR